MKIEKEKNQMNCPEHYELLDFSLNLLNQKEHNQIAAHLQNCMLCEKSLQQLKTLGVVFQGHLEATEQEASLELKQKTFAHLEQINPQPPIMVLHPWLKTTLTLAAVAAIFLMIALWPRFKSQPELSQENQVNQAQSEDLELGFSLDPKSKNQLTKAFDSELDTMMQDIDSEFENLSIEDEADQLAEDYLDDVIFATVEGE